MRFSFLILMGFLLLPGSALAQTVVGFLVTEAGLGDQSYNDMTMLGLTEAKEKLGIKLVYVVPDPGENDKGMERLLGMKPDLVVTNGVTMLDTVKNVAPAHPEVKFLLNDIALPGYGNVLSTTFAQQEASFLAGALAAWMTPGGRIGFVGGAEYPVIFAFRDGFLAGAAHADPTVKVFIDYVRPGLDHEGFTDPAKAHALADAMYNQGAAIVFGVAGRSGLGVIRAAVEHDVFAIGVDADQDHLAKGHVLTSVMKRLDTVTYKTVERFLQGGFAPGVVNHSLADGGVGLSPMRFTADRVPSGIKASLRALEDKIRTGAIVVPDALHK
ncbi:MAG: BMP family ABC transporter substrate-binding protein [Pseudodesulfovibrio sp.]